MLRPMHAILPAAFLIAALPTGVNGDEGHGTSPEGATILDQMREMHGGHEHDHDFEAIEALSPEEMGRAMEVMVDLGLVVPPMNSHRGRELFLDKGCIVCHQVNGVGGEIGPPLNAKDMPVPMNTFEFAARMWRGAGAMIAMQQELFGDQIELSGQDLADLVAFAHDAAEQREITAADIPEQFRPLIDQ